MFEVARISAFSTLIQYGHSAEKLISDLSDTVDELQLAELSFKARFLRLFVRGCTDKRVFRAYKVRTLS
ncbi:hypothetical protein HQN89_18995 [Paenibacillus frigoriresistens]|nr:hypothetical protein [Paenibacillus frigoriresistens]